MTKLFRALSIAAILFTASSATAQEKKEVTVGLGVGYTALDYMSFVSGPDSRVSFYVPVVIGALRIEPELGYWSWDEDGGTYQRQGSLGVGVLYELRRVQQTALYAGGRLGVSFAKTTPVAAADITGTDWRLAAVAGGEYFVSPTFSVGAEARFGILNIGEQKQSGVVVHDSISSWQTAGVVLLRFYLN
jgi:hypothetical protein